VIQVRNLVSLNISPDGESVEDEQENAAHIKVTSRCRLSPISKCHLSSLSRKLALLIPGVLPPFVPVGES
jgi:hypothetical protein